MTVGRDLSGVAGRIGALECPGVGNRREVALDARHDGCEGWVVCGRVVALDEDLFDLMFGEGIVDGACSLPRLADSALGVCLRLGAEGSSEHERDERERQPAPDGLLAMLSAPASGARR